MVSRVWQRFTDRLTDWLVWLTEDKDDPRHQR
jgi:hypothetical protein